MARTARKPLVFEEQERAPVPTAKPSIQEPLQQIGARIPTATYRRLKSRAALQGVTVGALIERAITEFLANHPD